MIRVYTDMVADLFHYGHVEFLKRARALGDYVLVGIHNDVVVETHKRKPILTMEERVKSVAGCRWVDEVIPDAPWRVDLAWISAHKIDMVVHGDDFSQEQIEYYYAVPLELGIFRTVPYHSGISTSDIIRRCREADVSPISHDELIIAKGIKEGSLESDHTPLAGVSALKTPSPKVNPRNAGDWAP